MNTFVRSKELIERQLFDSLKGSVYQDIELRLDTQGQNNFRVHRGTNKFQFRDFPLHLLTRQNYCRCKVDVFVDNNGNATVYPETLRVINEKI